MRSEKDVFEELANVCSSAGYIHAIAYLCHRVNMIGYSGEMTSEDVQRMFSKDRLIRTELSTLIGLLVKSDIEVALPAPEVFEQFVEKTESLLREMHDLL